MQHGRSTEKLSDLPVNRGKGHLDGLTPWGYRDISWLNRPVFLRKCGEAYSAGPATSAPETTGYGVVGCGTPGIPSVMSNTSVARFDT